MYTPPWSWMCNLMLNFFRTYKLLDHWFNCLLFLPRKMYSSLRNLICDLMSDILLRFSRHRVTHENSENLRRRPTSAVHDRWKNLRIGWPMTYVSHSWSLCVHETFPRTTYRYRRGVNQHFPMSMSNGVGRAMRVHWYARKRSIHYCEPNEHA